MATKTARIIARLLWFFPGLLLLLTWNQAQVALDLRETWTNGAPAEAEVFAFENSNRADVTYGYVSLRVTLADGQVLTKEKLSLPHSLLPRVQDQETVEVRVSPGSAQEVVIASLMPGHWLIAASQAAMSFVGMLLLAAGVFWWNRFLKKKGDPARRSLDEAAAA